MLKSRILRQLPKFFFSSLPEHSKLVMPALSPTMEKGTVVSWGFKEGDQVSTGDILFEVETDKATMGYELQDDGYLAKIIVAEGIPDIPVGDLVAIIVEEEEDIAAFKNYSPNQQTNQQSEEPKQEQQTTQQKIEQPPAQNYPMHQKLSLPALSPTMESGKVASWNFKEGDRLETGDILCEIETDKATMGYELQDEGYLAKIISQETGVDIKVGETIAIIVDDEEDIKSFENYVPGQEKQQIIQEKQQEKQQDVQQEKQQQTIQQNQSNNDRIFISPLAKKLAAEKNFDVNQIQGSGPNGRIIKNDIESHKPQKQAQAQQQQQKQQEQPQQKTQPPKQQPIQVSQDENPYTEIPLSNMRKVIASRLLESKTTIPHYYLTKSVQMDDCLRLRQQLNAQEGIKISVNDMIIKAASLALTKVPEVNSQWHGSFIRQFTHADISIAVSTDQGLITPIIFNANQKGLSEISSDVKSLAGKARDGKLKPNEYIGGTFAISNLGMMGIDNFQAIINPPQSAILAVGKTDKKVILDENNKENPYKVVQQMSVSMSCDHRVVDGAVGAQFLSHFANYLEKPYTMLL